MLNVKLRKRMKPVQIFLPGLSPVQEAIEHLSNAGTEQRGAVFTRPEVVDFILDLVGYTTDKELYLCRVLEPSFGHGDFIVPVVARLFESYRTHRSGTDIVSDLCRCVRGVEIHRASFAATRQKLLDLLVSNGVRPDQAVVLVEGWLVQGDYLLTPITETFTHVVGNPPYVRQELIPDALIEAYRQSFETIYDRADIYIPFIEKSLRLLASAGVLGFICADRWMKNRYGGPLREMVAKNYHLKVHVDMVDTPAFFSDVIAYPAIMVIANMKAGTTRLARRPAIQVDVLAALSQTLLQEDPPAHDSEVKEIAGVTRGSEPWILESSDQLALVRRLEKDFPTIEQAGCAVGIGVATGADTEFIGRYDDIDVEPDRKLPLAMTRDILTGIVDWQGYGVINPFADDGALVNLDEYPRLARYLIERRAVIAGRHVAKKSPRNWYRTIDRIYPAMAKKPKLLIPDIKGEAVVVYEGGRLYPHHNLYYITSDDWNLKALQAVLCSGIARLFVSTYSTKMRGGFLRFQAQYLRRIRVPCWQDVSEDTKVGLIAAAECGDAQACNEAVFSLYGFTKKERAAIGGNGK